MLDTICDVLKAAYDRNWISTRDGNCSFKRKDDEYLYITPSGVRKLRIPRGHDDRHRFPHGKCWWIGHGGDRRWWC